MMARRALTDEQVAEAAAEYAEGLGTEWLAERYGVALSTMQAALKRSGVALRPPGSPRVNLAGFRLGKMPDHVIAERAGCNVSTVRRKRRALGIPAYARGRR